MTQEINHQVERVIKAYEDIKRQVKTFSEQGEIGIKIAKGILEDVVKKGILTEYLAETITTDLKI